MIDRLQQTGRLLLEFADHPGGDGQATQAHEQLPNGSLAQSVRTGEQADHRREAWAKASAGRSRGLRAARPAAAPRAGERVDDVFGNVRLDRWNLGDLMPGRLGIIRSGFLGQRGLAFGADRRDIRHDILDTLRR